MRRTRSRFLWVAVLPVAAAVGVCTAVPNSWGAPPRPVPAPPEPQPGVVVSPPAAGEAPSRARRGEGAMPGGDMLEKFRGVPFPPEGMNDTPPVPKGEAASRVARGTLPLNDGRMMPEPFRSGPRPLWGMNDTPPPKKETGMKSAGRTLFVIGGLAAVAAAIWMGMARRWGLPRADKGRQSQPMERRKDR